MQELYMKIAFQKLPSNTELGDEMDELTFFLETPPMELSTSLFAEIETRAEALLTAVSLLKV
jgi:hypothetical protein